MHDNLGFKFRSSHYNSAGTVKGDKLCMDASETRVVVSVCLALATRYSLCFPGGRDNQPEGVGVHPGGGGPKQPGHRHRPPCQDDPAKVDYIMAKVLICQIFKSQVTDVDDKADKVHSCNGASCEAAAAF